MNSEHESMEVDVLFVGAGPACLSGAIRLMQLAGEKGLSLEVAVIEKGAEVGAHSLSGAILNPIALKELVPDFLEQGCPIETTVRDDEIYFLSTDKAYRIPFVPSYLENQGYYIISLSRYCRWLAEIAEGLGVNILPGFAGNEVLYDADNASIIGVRTGDKGIGKDGRPRSNFEPGVDILAKVTVFGEGARGSLMKEIAVKLGISGSMPDVFETGIREIIELPEKNYFTSSYGNDLHFLGYPLGMNTPGGGFIYEMKDNQIAIGYLTALSYEDPLLDPYDAFIRFKLHPFVSGIIQGGKVIEQGARTVSIGGYHAMPKLCVGGGLFVGAAAAMHNAPALKGIHTAMKSGMLAAEAIGHAVEKGDYSAGTLNHYCELFEKSWLREELVEGRNFSAALSKKAPVKFFHLAAQYLNEGLGFRDRLPLEEDCKTLKPVKSGAVPLPIDAKSFDGVLVVDKLTGVYLSKTLHREDQPSHLVVHDTQICVTQCYETYQSPCTRFCPGSVYEIRVDEKTFQRELKLNPSNCLHCKTCDVKDPFRNITWTCPEGGDGPGYRRG
jgi:electron-transferring-flavoprotein dehydrogenase